MRRANILTLAAAVLVLVLPAVAREANRKNLLDGVNENTPGPQLFLRAYEVFSHPRCSNCHPQNAGPPWWDINAKRVHGMNVQRGEEDKDGAHGLPGMQCVTCHQEQNGKLTGSPPGAHGWRLAPRTMGWGGKSPAEMCKQIKDPSLNGNRNTPAKIIGHMVGIKEREDDDLTNKQEPPDPLVRWAWEPGLDRERAPGEFVEFVQVLRWWKSHNLECPTD
jgi:hypothetical protein